MTRKLSEIHGITASEAKHLVDNSAIQELYSENPEYVSHISIYTWVEEIWNESMNKRG